MPAASPTQHEGTARPLSVGYLRDGYSERRSIFGAVDSDRVDYRLVPRGPIPLSWSSLAARITRRFTPTIAEWLRDRAVVFRAGGDVDLIHGFNDVGFGDLPWISTFETVAPRYHRTRSLHHGPSPGFEKLASDPYVKRGMEALAAPSCRALIAMSECNLSMQRSFLRHFPGLAPEIEAKLIQMHPPQPVLGSVRDPSDDPGIALLFVGNSFFRKGGMEMLRAVAHIRERYPVTLTIVSGLHIDPYARHETRDQVAEARRIIETNSHWITHYERLENAEVTRLMCQADVGLLPTWADTYGYVVLEYQAAGCPVVSSNVRALPEMNDEESGWLIEVPKNDYGEGLYTTASDRAVMARVIQQGIEETLDRICTHPGQIHQRSVGALARIRAKHDPDRYAQWILDLYQEAVA